MKNLGVVALSGAAMLHLASAACCRANQCLKAVVDAGGLADCSAKLPVVTVTPSAVTLTETLTAVESAVETALFTETLTETAATETVLFTELTTITAATQTDMVSETVTVPVTTTVVSTAAPVTTTVFVYPPAQRVRRAASSGSRSIPYYAAEACADWEKYVKACGCAGVEPATITVSAVTERVTVTASDAITTTASTLSLTQTDVVTLTETVSSTATDIISLAETVAATETVTASPITTVTTTVTSAPPLVSVQCKATNVFRFYDSSSRWMVANTVTNVIEWQTTINGMSPVNLPVGMWTIDPSGYLELRYSNNAQTEALVPVVSAGLTDDSAQVTLKPKSSANDEVAAGSSVKVQACVPEGDVYLRMQAAGRTNIVDCGNTLYLSKDATGSDVGPDCHLLRLHSY
ncbi:hypothetical protein QBC42DRAFT_337495 [Cladorrhinum samala]|uniref:Uncharacterized protein n=1 Tax=Cladorrhinum samala TaxID=585594 RepID=A0AAV9HS31_9PEZI|nr:hypothetical protein QBC42DRAFT_337495 [Cladorrhinum samala]